MTMSQATLQDERGEGELLRVIIFIGLAFIVLGGAFAAISTAIQRASVARIQPANTATAEVDSLLSDVRAATAFDPSAVSAFQSGTQSVSVPVVVRRGTTINATLKVKIAGGSLDALLNAPQIPGGAHIATVVSQGAPDFNTVTTSSATPHP